MNCSAQSYFRASIKYFITPTPAAPRKPGAAGLLTSVRSRFSSVKASHAPPELHKGWREFPQDGAIGVGVMVVLAVRFRRIRQRSHDLHTLERLLRLPRPLRDDALDGELADFDYMLQIYRRDIIKIGGFRAVAGDETPELHPRLRQVACFRHAA